MKNDPAQDEAFVHPFLLHQSSHRMVIRYHSELGHLFVPGIVARLPNKTDGYILRTNEAGFRSNWEFEQAKGDLPRIVFLGDSFTAGDGVPNEQRFCDLIGDRLGVETFNYAVAGSGTDQQLLVFEKFARQVEADLIIFCVYVENIERIQLSHRVSVDRTTGRRVLVPKPYFTLADGALKLNHVPVPRERPPVENETGVGRFADDAHASQKRVIDRVRDIYRGNPTLKNIGRKIQTRTPGLWSTMIRTAGVQPYEAYVSPDTPGWKLMQAILGRFLEAAAPTPVLIVPIPEYRYYAFDAEPLYQKLYDNLAAPRRGVQVADVTTPLRTLERSRQERLLFKNDQHLTPYGHEQMAGLLCEEIEKSKLLPATAAKVAGGSRPRAADVKGDSTCILGISCFYHNSAAALVRDGVVVAAAEEERFSRLKNDKRFPHGAVNFCLEEGRVHQNDLDAVVYYDQASLTFERLMHTHLANGVANGPSGEACWLRTMPTWVRTKLHLPQVIRRSLQYEGLVLQEIHHRSHAASAFYPSPFESAAILTIDGVGEWATASIGVGEGSRIRLVKEMHFPHSLGLLYSAFTQFTGFKVNSGEYKMMGLAPYGQPRYVDLIKQHLVDVKEDGSIELNMDYFAFLAEPTMTNEKFADLFGGPARPPESRIARRVIDLARSVQVVVEEAVLRMSEHARKITGKQNLCLAGGVALNCVANGRLLREGSFDRLWIQPAASDAGCALGAALDAYHGYFNGERKVPENGRAPQGGSTLGPAFANSEIAAFVETHGYPAQRLAPDQRAARIAELLAEGKVVGHFDGRAEFGPRALGARSILGDARHEQMQTTLNLKIKYRESFRPFAPSVLAERAAEYFDLEGESPYMQLVAPVRAERRLPFELDHDEQDMLKIVRKPRSDVPAVTHVDNSARIQTVSREDHPRFHALIKAFEALTGCGLVLNTSFNVRGEPIVSTPYDAYRCFMRTEMDVLVLEDYLLVKQDQPSWPEARGEIEPEHDEPDSVQDDAADHDLTVSLRRVFTEDFAPVIATVREADDFALKLRFRSDATTWLDAAADQSGPAIFAVPPALDQVHPDHVRMADAITSCWRAGPATEALRPIVAKLLAIGRKHGDVEEAPKEEEVGDAIYEMY